MVLAYRVVDLTTVVIDPVDTIIEGVSSPEDAARQVMGIDVVRSGVRKDLVARVYWQALGHPVTMVRLYRRLEAPNGRR